MCRKPCTSQETEAVVTSSVRIDTLARKHVRPLGVGLLGLGTVGSGVARVLLTKADALERRIGRAVELRKVLVRDPTRPRSVELSVPLVTDPNAVLDDPDIDVVVEVMGGEEPARSLILQAVERGKHVVTANKEVMAKHGPDILEAALANNVTVAYEASVGGGIPLIGPFQLDLAANEITSVVGIVNGTTNYILTRMTESGAGFDEALKEAQDLGYAEPDPTNDVEGWDAAYKLAILASLAFGAPVSPEHVHREGITQVSQRDILYAAEMGYRIKLLAIARLVSGQVEARVHPALVHQGSMLASVDGSFNAVEVTGDLIGPALFYGRGAGSEPTASAVVADLIALGTSGGRGSTRAGGARATSATHELAADALLHPPVDARSAGCHGLDRDGARRPRHQPGERRPEGERRPRR